MVVGAEDVGFRQRAAAVGRCDAVEVVDARHDAVLSWSLKSVGARGRERREVVLERVDVVDVQQGQALAAEEDLVLDDGAAAEIRGERAGTERFVG